MELNDDSLCDVYLAKKKVEKKDEIFRTNTHTYYMIGTDALLCSPKDENDYTFQIFNLEYKNTPQDPMQELFVNPNEGKIEFITTIGDTQLLRLSAEFDKYSNNWDVRSYNEYDRKPTDLITGLSELDEQDREGYINLIESAVNFSARKENINRR